MENKAPKRIKYKGQIYEAKEVMSAEQVHAKRILDGLQRCLDEAELLNDSSYYDSLFEIAMSLQNDFDLD